VKNKTRGMMVSVHMMDEMRGKRKKTISLNNVWISGDAKFHFFVFDDSKTNASPVPNN
jgi:hypothetical protein